MSVVIRFPDNTVKVLVKGADSSMFSILAEDNGRNNHLRNLTQSHLTDYSSQGLRTLVVAARDLTDEELSEWQNKYEDASTSLTERSVKLRQTAAFIECNLNLLGATGIEDKLQDGVPEAIESLRQAGIKVWVLTGDKQETAISIGLSSKLLTTDMNQIIINGDSEHECRRLLADAKAKYFPKSFDSKFKYLKHKNDTDISLDNTKSSMTPLQHGGKEEELLSTSHALIIDGNSLVYILEKDLEPEAIVFTLFQMKAFICIMICFKCVLHCLFLKPCLNFSYNFECTCNIVGLASRL